MIRSIFLLWLLAVTAAGTASAGGFEGSWTAWLSEKRPGVLQFMMQTRTDGQNGMGMEIADFEGLSEAQVTSRTRRDVTFRLVREAGTITYEGSFRDGKGAGQFTFEPDPEYPRKLRQLGVEMDTPGNDREHELFSLTIFDVSTDFIRSMRNIGYDLPLEKYVAFRIFRVDPEYVRDMDAVGFKKLSADKLVETRIHGATPEYIREMRAAGEDLPLDKYIESRIFQVTPEFRAEMAKAGYASLDRDVLVQFKIHGVTASFVHELRKLGYTRIPAQKLVEMRIHGVTPEFIRRLGDAGYHDVPIDKMVQMRIFDIKPEMVKALDDSGQQDPRQ
jgi:hypothetical protein